MAIGTTAAIIGGVLGAGSIASGLLGSHEQSQAIESAADTQAAAADQATALQREMWQKGLELQQPFYDVGLAALPDLQKAIMGGYDFTASPVAKYAIQTGGRELMRGLGARGLAGSGLAPSKLAELTSQVYATDYDKQIARLSGLVDIGRGTASNLSTLGQNYATTAGNIGTSSAEDLASSILASGRNQASLYQGMGQIPMNLASLYLMSGGGFSSGSSAGAGAWGA